MEDIHAHTHPEREPECITDYLYGGAVKFLTSISALDPFRDVLFTACYFKVWPKPTHCPICEKKITSKMGRAWDHVQCKRCGSKISYNAENILCLQLVSSFAPAIAIFDTKEITCTS